MEAPSLRNARTWTPRALAALAFAGYALVAPGGFYWLDSAELSAAALDLGSPHPTGFPLYMVLARVAAFVPIGELAFRVNLLSAVCAALAVLWTARLVIELARGDAVAVVAAVGAGATLALGLVFARQATVAEIYAPTAALIAGTLLLLDRVVVSGDPRLALALAVVVGLGAGTHTSYALAVPVFVVLGAVRLRRGARWPLMVPLLAILIAGALYAYLPVRSATGRTAALDWGHPATAPALVEHVSAARIRRAYAGEMRGTAATRVGPAITAAAEDTADALGPIALIAAVAGLGWLLRHRRTRWTAAALGIVIAGDFVYAFWINPMGQIDLQNGVPLAIAAAVCAGVGVAWFGRSLGRAGPYATGAVAMLLCLPPALLSVPALAPAADGQLPRRWSEAALAAAPPGAIIIVESDSLAAGLIYLTTAEQARPDVAVLVKQHVAADPVRSRAVLARAGIEAELGGAPLAAVLRLGRPILWEVGSRPLPRGYTLVAGAPVSHLVPAERLAEPPPDDLRNALARASRLFDDDGVRDRAARRTYAVTLNQLGRVAHGRGQDDLAVVAFDAALAVRPQHAPALVNRGTVAAAGGDLEQAARLTERAIELDPTSVTARINAARYQQRLGQAGRARGHLAAALELAPDSGDAWALSALLDLNAGEPERAFEALRRALELDPGNRDARDLLRQLDKRRTAPR